MGTFTSSYLICEVYRSQQLLRGLESEWKVGWGWVARLGFWSGPGIDLCSVYSCQCGQFSNRSLVLLAILLTKDHISAFLHKSDHCVTVAQVRENETRVIWFCTLSRQRFSL